MTDDKPRRDPAEAVTWPMRVAAAWTWRVLVVGLGVYLVVELFLKVELIAFSFILALFFTAVLHPLERFFRRLPGPRSTSALLALLIGLIVLAGIASFVSLQVNDHSSQLGDQITDLVNHTQNWLKNGPLHLKSKDIDDIGNKVKKAVTDHQDALVSGAIETVKTIFEALGALLLILLSTFFLLRDGEQIWAWTLRLFPRPAQERVDVAGRAGWRTLGGYMRGQLTIALFHGVAVTILLLILQVPLAAALGVLIFLGSFVPIIGLIVAGALCTAVTLLEHGLTSAIVVAVAITVLVQLESHLLQPVIMSRTVEVHPLAIAISVLTGTVLAGIVGALLAVPLVAFLNTTILALRRTPAVPVGDSGFPVRSRESPRGDPVDMTDVEGRTELPEDGDDGTGAGAAGSPGTDADDGGSPARDADGT